MLCQCCLDLRVEIKLKVSTRLLLIELSTFEYDFVANYESHKKYVPCLLTLMVYVFLEFMLILVE